MDESELFEYVAATYGAAPEYLWGKFPGAFVFRHQENRKWFCVGMEVERAKLEPFLQQMRTLSYWLIMGGHNEEK